MANSPSSERALARLATAPIGAATEPIALTAPPAGRQHRRAWFFADAAALAVGLALGAVTLSPAASGEARAAAAAGAVLALALLALRGAYDPRSLRGHVGILDYAREAAVAISLAAMATITLAAVAFPHWNAAPVAARTWAASVLLVALARAVVRILVRRQTTRSRHPVLIVGAGRVGARLEQRLDELDEGGLEVVGFLDSDPVADRDLPYRRAPVLGGVGSLADAVRETGARHVILAFSSGSDRTLLAVVRSCREMGVAVWVVPRLFDSTSARMSVDHIGGMPVLRIGPPGRAAELRIKSAFDRVAATVAILMFAPLLLAIAAAIRFSSPGPVLFRQRRVGCDGVPFDMLKFRSMELPKKPLEAACAGDAQMSLHDPAGPGGVEGADRRTRVGTFLRQTSLDELPQLFNIARGEMSFVGPRPERQQFVELFADCVDRYSERHRMKCGLTGWAQVHGLRGQTSLPKRVEWDNWYIDNWSLWLDLKVLLMTAGAMRKGAG